MSLEINIGKRTSVVELLSRDRSMYSFLVDGREYAVDVVKVSEGVYSVLYDNKSFYIELIEGRDSRQYTVNTKNRSYELEVMDAESKYIRSRSGAAADNAESRIVSPMPGKVVSIPVSPGEEVTQGQTLIVVSAMKMESEYKAGRDGRVARVLVKEGDTVDGNQVLIELEA